MDREWHGPHSPNYRQAQGFHQKPMKSYPSEASAEIARSWVQRKYEFSASVFYCEECRAYHVGRD